MWIAPKLDWSSVDHYNFEDLNRVERNTETVAKMVGQFTNLPPFVYVLDRTMKHIDFADSLNRLESIQDRLANRATPKGWVKNKMNWKANDPFLFTDANRLERNMTLLYERYKGNVDAQSHCGLIICGEALV